MMEYYIKEINQTQLSIHVQSTKQQKHGGRANQSINKHSDLANNDNKQRNIFQRELPSLLTRVM